MPYITTSERWRRIRLIHYYGDGEPCIHKALDLVLSSEKEEEKEEEEATNMQESIATFRALPELFLVLV